jgi:hypothetical protein
MNFSGACSEVLMTRWMAGPALAGAAIVLLTVVPTRARQSQSPADPATPSTSAPSFAGVWRYNEKESINAQTGRPELGPQAGARRPGGTPTAPARPPQTSGSGDSSSSRGGEAGGGGFSGGGGGGFRNDPFALTPFAMAEVRGFMRDLLEVPFALTIRVDADTVTFIDDLGRELSFPTDGRKQKYQVSASRFDAKVRWEGSRLLKEIEAAHGFKMNEQYFLSDDGRRLFVIVRVGEQRKDARPVGVNRVYDRGEQ